MRHLQRSAPRPGGDAHAAAATPARPPFSAYMKQLRRIAPQLFESVASAPRRTKLQHHGDEHNAPEHATVPQIARLLGYGGLIPSAALAVLALDRPSPLPGSIALIAYGAVILSFVGAPHWAFGMLVASSDRARTMLCWSVIPALLGWLALLATPNTALVLLAATFALHFSLDLRLVRQHSPARLVSAASARLTLVARKSLLLSLFA